MNIPADASPTLILGRTYDAKSSKPANDVFQPDIPTKKTDVNKFSFNYQIVKSSKDVNDLLDISGELSLKIKAGVIKVTGKGQYVNESKTEEGKTTLLAVMKCITVTETIDGSAKPRDDVLNPGTHYVRSVTYGAEMVASLKFKTSTKSVKEHIKASAEGELTAGTVNVGLKAALDKLSAECNDLSDFQIKYFATELPDKLPVTTEELIELIGEFTSRMEDINEGQGVPIMFELQPIENILPNAKPFLREKAEAFELEEMEERLDDLRSAQDLANAYLKKAKEEDNDVISFLSEAKKVERIFLKAISALGKEDERAEMEASQNAYIQAIDGNDLDHKFVRQWKKIYSTKIPTTSIKLPEGKDLTLVLFGKTGCGKSTTGNRILGYDNFTASSDATSVTQLCFRGIRNDERRIDVIDTPDHCQNADCLQAYVRNLMKICTFRLDGIWQKEAQIFPMAPNGFDAIIFVLVYGQRFSVEEETALAMFRRFMGSDAIENMILLLTHGDQVEREAEEMGETVEQTLEKWLKTLPDAVQKFITEIKDRAFLFNNLLHPDKEPEEYKKQLSRLITLIDEMTKGRQPFVHPLTKASLTKDDVDQYIKAIQQTVTPFSFLDIQIRSEGYDDTERTPETNGLAYINVNGKDYSPRGRGHNVVIVDAKTGAVLDSKSFDTLGNPSAGDRLSDYLNATNGEKIVLVAIQDSGSNYVSKAFDALKRLGAKDPILEEYRSSFALVGYAKSSKPAWITQEQKRRYKGPSEIFLRIPRFIY